MKLTDIAPYSEMGEAVKHVYLEFVGANDKNISGKSNKFWESAVFKTPTGFVFVVRFGRYGAKGTIKEKPFYSRYDAKNAFRKKRSEKRKKGYTKEIDIITRLGTLVDVKDDE